MCLELVNIKKSYGNNMVLNGINATIENGIHGFLGANGVGKTNFYPI